MHVKDTLNELISPARLCHVVIDVVVNVDVDIVVDVIVDVDIIVDIVDVIVDVVDVVVDTAVVYTSQSLLGLQPKGTLMLTCFPCYQRCKLQLLQNRIYRTVCHST